MSPASFVDWENLTVIISPSEYALSLFSPPGDGSIAIILSINGGAGDPKLPLKAGEVPAADDEVPAAFLRETVLFFSVNVRLPTVGGVAPDTSVMFIINTDGVVQVPLYIAPRSCENENNASSSSFVLTGGWFVA